jgi:adenosylcobinamide-GDP ribazoletransferase
LSELGESSLSSEAEPLARARGQWPAPLRGARAAFVFLSRIPLGGFPYRATDWQWAAAHFPLVGLVVGAAAGGVFQVCSVLSLSRPLAAVLAVSSSVWITGGFHEDGLADSADGLGAAHGGKRALEIMKDSRIGSYGALALILSLMVRVMALAELQAGAWFGLIFIHCLARIGPVWLMASECYVGDPARSKSADMLHTRPVHVASAAAWGLACAGLGVLGGWLPWRVALAVALALALTTWLCARHFRKAVGGITGDLLGATEQIGEVAAWLVFVAAQAA